MALTSPMLSRPFPRVALWGAGIAVALSIAAAAAGRFAGFGHDETAITSQPLEIRDIRFEDQDNGAILVRDAQTDAVIAQLAPATNGFVRSAVRGLVRERRREDVGQAPPFRLIAWADGRLTLHDTGTGRMIDLRAFGATQVEAFARFLPHPEQGK